MSEVQHLGLFWTHRILYRSGDSENDELAPEQDEAGSGSADLGAGKLIDHATTLKTSTSHT